MPPTAKIGSFAPTNVRVPLERAIAAARRVMERDTVVVAATVVALNVLRIASTIFLTRLLAPEIFGVVGILASIAFVMVMISDLGFQAFVVRHRDGDDPRFLDAIWTIRLIRAAVLTVLLAAMAAPIAEAFGKPALALVIAVSALQFLIEGFSSLSVVTALRTGQLKRLSVLDLLVAVAQLILSVAAALVWQSYWAIVAALLASAVLRSVLSYAMFANSARRFRIDRGYAVELWGFARFVTGSSVITMLLAQTDKIVLSRIFSLDEFGLYILAANLALAPLAFTGAYASRVLYPIYAKTWREEPTKLRAVFYDARRTASLFYMVAAGGLIGSAPLIVDVLYDPRYAEAAFYLRLLAIGSLLALGNASANEVLTATGRPRLTFQANLVRLAWLTVAGPIAFTAYGTTGLILVVGAIEVPALLYSWWQLHRAGLLRLRQELLMLAAGGFGTAVGLLALAAL